MSIYSEVNALITDENWNKGSATQNWGEGKTCLLGWKSIALYGTVTKAYLDDGYNSKLASIISEQFSDRINVKVIDTDSYIITNFNDHDHTTLDDIRLVLEKADADE